MRIGITGSSGLIGTALRQQLEAEGHEVRRFLRGKPEDPAAVWNPANGWIRPGALEGLDAIVHLAGKSIGGGDGRSHGKRPSARAGSTQLACSFPNSSA